ncbi:response regulator transcription factor [Propionicimonas sp.]|uniref:response regulator transcription factor n=1 Tax=Propionicimonas sp. TaxID=1955623 RepID=UPI00180181CE|nr:response regulator transcription factor [Propionicimonas sp.]MBU3976309.1 response regulator transcription factor [Actinomycetota bacterium]MBA3022098.1 response regulator transcription factor [Propionicimonas sp.]MBU3987466.1 response regulator transcription factor [Actinomycetota bacterium]MBU4006589.1 response regulator transcription factor [Actinomycetota bacterium]MBU4065194.1 response regulator transcription factor [Actinomycetota bacterium]
MTQVLIVEDEARIASFVAAGLRAAGYQTHIEGTGSGVAELVAGGEFDLVILDVGLPDLDGFEVLRQVRQRDASIPVIMLTARSAVRDRVAGLEGGADDYLVKPFSFEELLARVRSRLRHTGQDSALSLRHRDLELDLRTRRVRVDGAEIELSAREFALAEMFLRHPDQVLSREQLLSAVWGYDFDPGSNVVDVYVRYLRRKLGADTIHTVRGMGYRLA